MLFDWLAREGWIVLNWWLLVTLAGAAVLPLCMRLLGALPDRGYTLARAVGLLLIGFVFWLLASLGFLRNTPGSIVLSWFIVLVSSLLIYRQGEPVKWRAWWQENRRVVIVAEILFLALLLGWTIVRAYQNNLTGTEKPMDLAFMSAAQRSETYPPNDPWMSGYAISYYYLGYVLSAMLTKMSAIPSTIGFNMTISMLFALTGLTTFGVVYNLVRSRAVRAIRQSLQVIPSPIPALLAGLLGMVFVILMGNLQVVLIEAPYHAQAVSEDYLQFWGTQARTEYNELSSPTTNPTQWDYWWWFRASRVLTDYQLNGDIQPDWYAQPIDEFPQFSFLLADNHPHVLALPFAVLALGLALNVVLSPHKPTRSQIIFYGLCLGGLVFLNTWDGPIYMVILVGAEAVRRLRHHDQGRLRLNDLIELVILGLALGGVTVVAYLPFFVSFRSQAAGLLPNLITPTQFQQYFIMFGTFVIILAVFLIVEAWRGQRRSRMNWSFGILSVSGILLVLFAVALAFILIASVVLSQQTAQARALGQPDPPITDTILRFVDENGGWDMVLPGVIFRRIEYGLTTVLLVVGIALILGRLFPRFKPGESQYALKNNADNPLITYSPATGFALLLVGAGLIMSLVPEFIYLRDNFSTRINTIFKFYYQAWVLFSIASAYAIYTLLADFQLRLPPLVIRVGLSLIFAIAILAGMVYPILGIHNRMFVETGRFISDTPAPLTLDGGPTMIDSNDYEAIMCLNDQVDGGDAVVAEAIGNAYNPRFGRVGALTGIPIVLGWENHERQWRGSTYDAVVGTRSRDIPELYTDLRWDVAQQIINTYGIDYILYGESERMQYGSVGEEKFLDNLEVICTAGNTRIFRVDKQAMDNVEQAE